MGRNLILAIGIVLLGIAPSKAGGLLPLARIMPRTHISVAAPQGFISFCIRFVDQCASDGPARLALAPNQWTELQKVNDEVNQELTPEDDMSHYGFAEFWTIPTDGRGDCEDYALLKRKKLIAAGFPIRALRMAVAKTAQGERHAVLTVATDHGGYVLDNLAEQVRSWDNTGYQWIERQDPDTAWGWESLAPAQAAVAAVDQPAVPAM